MFFRIIKRGILDLCENLNCCAELLLCGEDPDSQGVQLSIRCLYLLKLSLGLFNLVHVAQPLIAEIVQSLLLLYLS